MTEPTANAPETPAETATKVEIVNVYRDGQLVESHSAVNGQPVEATPATSWRDRREGLYRLPGSGNVARLRRPSLMTLAAAGAVPNPLSQDVLRYLASKDGQRLNEAEQVAEYKRNAKAFIEVAARCLVEPRLWVPPAETPRGKGEPVKTAPDYEAGEIGPEDLADNDYTWIFFSFVGGDANWRETFRVG